MKQPTGIGGRLLPRNDFEGDDRTPGASGWVTCQDTAVGRMVAYATNGRCDRDGKVYRAAIPYDPDGVTLAQMQPAVKRVAGVNLFVPADWRWADALAHLRAGKGLVIDGWYSEIPSAYRFQQGADFAHAIWVSHFSHTSGMRVWDPLNPDIGAYGRWIPGTYIEAFAKELSRRMGTLSLYVGYVPLGHL